MNDHTPLRHRLADRLLDSEPDAELRAERGRKWKSENADAIASSNAWVREHGLPLARFRKY